MIPKLAALTLQMPSVSAVQLYIPNSPIILLFFVFSFQIATLLEQDRANARAVVNLIVTKEILKLDFEDLCEYIGEIEDL